MASWDVIGYPLVENQSNFNPFLDKSVLSKMRLTGQFWAENYYFWTFLWIFSVDFSETVLYGSQIVIYVFKLSVLNL